mmetsp:Transcript_4427/g.5652  ORF Transcript_4427/g.5652 Transcript_4427/m.5652 type:complete len:86 (+) Transcript_4427:64-321(+)
MTSAQSNTTARSAAIEGIVEPSKTRRSRNTDPHRRTILIKDKIALQNYTAELNVALSTDDNNEDKFPKLKLKNKNNARVYPAIMN